MKQVRVLKEMPFAMVGDNLENVGNKYISHYKIPGDSAFRCHSFDYESVSEMVQDGWLEWVEEPKCNICNDTGTVPARVTLTSADTLVCSCQEPKSLSCKFEEKFTTDQYFMMSNKLKSECFAHVATDHFKARFDEALKNWVRGGDVRKAMFEE